MLPKRAVITGASSGIGLSMAKQLATQGVNLVIAARRIDQLKQLAHELSAQFKISVEVFQADLTDPEVPKKLYEFSTQDGKTVDFLINNAGVGPYRHFLKTNLEEHQRLIELNMTSLTSLCHLFATHMIQHKKPSYILNVASTAAFGPVPRFAVYGASKAYVKYFSEVLRYELKDTNVSVSCLCPGGTKTEFLERNNQKMVGSEAVMMSSDDVARIGLQGTFNKKSVIVTGWLNRLVAFLSNFVPNCFNLPFVEMIMAKAVAERE